MKDRFVTLGLAIGALVLVYILFLPKPVSPQDAPARPVSSEKRSDGYLVAWRWLDSSHVPETAWREGYDRLQGSFADREGGNLLVTALPHENAVSAGEIDSLHAWVRRGNTLLAMAALDDTPLWAAGGGSSSLIEAVRRVTGFDVTVIRPDKGLDKAQELRAAVVELTASRTSIIEPRGAHPLMQGVHTVKVVSALPASQWRVGAKDEFAVLNVAGVQGSGAAALWVRREGEGQIILMAFAGAFSNANIAAADNGRLLSNLVAWSLRPGGTVIFDDAHQGVVNYYDAKAFFADPRLHRTLAWLLLLWFVFVLGIQRLRVHAPEWRPIDITAFIGISGDFLASAATPFAVASRLIANFFNEIRRRVNLREDGAPLWDWLARQPRVKPAEVRLLREWHARALSGKSVDLVKLQKLLCQLQEDIA